MRLCLNHLFAPGHGSHGDQSKPPTNVSHGYASSSVTATSHTTPYTRTGNTGNISTPLTSLTPKGHTHELTNGKTVIDRATKTVSLCQPRKADGTTADSHGGKPNCPQTGKNDAEKYSHATKAYANYDSKDARIARPTLTTSNAETTTTLKT